MSNCCLKWGKFVSEIVAHSDLFASYLYEQGLQRQIEKCY